MSHPEQLYQWEQTIAQHLPSLSKPQSRCLALWTLGMVLAGACGLSAVASVLALLHEQSYNTVRQRLREFYKEAPKKAGKHRQELCVQACFAPLLAWVMSWWQASQIALALDATTLGDRYVVLTISVLYRGCAVPVAWRILPANVKQSWRPEWLGLLHLLYAALPREVRVLVLADRGLYARWLFGRIVRLGWHPLLRINARGSFRPEGEGFRPLSSFVATVGSRFSGRGTAFTTHNAQIECTLVAFYGEGYEDPWLLLTDLPAEASDACWYGLRTWIEQGFKFLKRAGWQWQATRMTDPSRVERFWLALSVATLWVLSEGAFADPSVLEGTFAAVPVVGERTRSGFVGVGIFRLGRLCLLVHFLTQKTPPPPAFVPEPWPSSPPPRAGPKQSKGNKGRR